MLFSSTVFPTFKTVYQDCVCQYKQILDFMMVLQICEVAYSETARCS